MSKTDKTAKSLETKRSTSGVAAHSSAGALGTIDERRARRWELDVPLTVYGRGPTGAPFYQEAEVINVSATGGLIVLHTPVHEGQDLLLINNWTSIEQICRIVRVRSRGAETFQIGVAFPSPNPDFWFVPDSPCDLPEVPADEGF